jgi:xylulokinase
VLAIHNHAIPVHSPRPGWAEIAPAHWLAASAEGTRAALAQAGLRADQVAAIGLSNMIGTLAPVDAEGAALRPAIAYYDTRAAAQAVAILERAPDIPAVTANRVTAGNTALSTLLWLREHGPRIYAGAASFSPTGTFLFRWLTGEQRVDLTTASFMGLLDYRTRQWSAALAERFGIDLARLPALASSASMAPLRARAAEALGLAPGTPVALGGLDGAMASLGVGAIHAGDAFDVSGTSEMVAVCLPHPVAAPELLARWHVVPDLWVLIGAMSTAGAAWQWLGRTAYAAESAALGSTHHVAMTAEAEASPPGANGLLFLPHLMGERAPLWDPHARGVFFGLSLSSARGDLARAVMEGVAYAMRHLLELIEAYGGVPVRRVTMVGGAARNALWRQIKADVWNVEIAVSPVSEATALGAALNAGVGAGLYASYAEAVATAVPAPQSVTEPDAVRHAAYERPYRLYRRLYPALAETMRLAAEP